MTKVIFLFSGLVHYFSAVLNRLNITGEFEIVVVVPLGKGVTIGEGVYESEDGVQFQVVRLPEVRLRDGKFSFSGLDQCLAAHRPGIIVTAFPYLSWLLTDSGVQSALGKADTKIILKDHPFRLPMYDAEMARITALGIDGSLRLVSVATKLATVLPANLIRVLLSPSIPIIRSRHRKRLAERKWLYCRCDAIVCYVEEAYAIFGSYGVPRENIFISYNSPDTDAFAKIYSDLLMDESVRKHPYSIIHVGRLIEWKRVDMLIRAVAALRAEFPQIRLQIVGIGPEEDKLLRLSEEMGISAAVEFIGGVYHPVELGRLLMENTVYVLAGMGGISINDAMCFGLPVICSVCDGTEKKLVRDQVNGLFFRDGDLGDLQEKIARILSDPSTAEAMGQESLRVIREEINIHTVVRGYESAFRYALRDC